MYGVIGLACDEKADGLTKGGLIQLLHSWEGRYGKV